MKKLVCILALLGLSQFGFSQDVKESINWVRQHANNFDHVACPTLNIFAEDIEIDENQFKIKTEYDGSVAVKWEELEEVEKDEHYIYLISRNKAKNEPIKIKLFIGNQEYRNNYVNKFQAIAKSNRNA